MRGHSVGEIIPRYFLIIHDNNHSVNYTEAYGGTFKLSNSYTPLTNLYHFLI